jgi:hypothetical protein
VEDQTRVLYRYYVADLYVSVSLLVPERSKYDKKTQKGSTLADMPPTTE